MRSLERFEERKFTVMEYEKDKTNAKRQAKTLKEILPCQHFN